MENFQGIIIIWEAEIRQHEQVVYAQTWIKFIKFSGMLRYELIT